MGDFLEKYRNLFFDEKNKPIHKYLVQTENPRKTNL